MNQTMTRTRWECTNHTPAVLLGRYAPGGDVEITSSDGRLYIASGVVTASCPTCGATHILDLTGLPVPKGADAIAAEITV